MGHSPGAACIEIVALTVMADNGLKGGCSTISLPLVDSSSMTSASQMTANRRQTHFIIERRRIVA